MHIAVDRQAIRALAGQHLQELGLTSPPIDYRASLEIRQLELLNEPLEVILAASPLLPEERRKIDGFIHLEQRIVCLRGDMHPHQRRTGALHEVAHDVIPWQRELLHYCPIFSLPDHLQAAFEREANLFAIECLFMGERFSEQMRDYPNDLATAVDLAEQYDASYEATFRHYVEMQDTPCLLLASRLVSSDGHSSGALWSVSQYIQSPSASLRILPGVRFGSPVLTAMIVPAIHMPAIVEHELVVMTAAGKCCYRAQSFWNTYKLFTLVWLA